MAFLSLMSCVRPSFGPETMEIMGWRGDLDLLWSQEPRYGHIEEAMTAAQELDDRNSWNRLGLEALRQGNQQIVEMAPWMHSLLHVRAVRFCDIAFKEIIAYRLSGE